MLASLTLKTQKFPAFQDAHRMFSLNVIRELMFFKQFTFVGTRECDSLYSRSSQSAIFIPLNQIKARYDALSGHAIEKIH